MKTLLVTPPLVQLNTPYPATAYLAGYLGPRGHDVVQADPGLVWALRLFSGRGMSEALALLGRAPVEVRERPAVAHLLAHGETVVALADLVLAFLQGRDQGLTHRIAARRLLPEGPRFSALGPVGDEEAYLAFAFGSLGVHDKARYLATLFIEDLADAVTEGIDPELALSRYGERLAHSPASIEPLLDVLEEEQSPGVPLLTARLLDEVTGELLLQHRPTVVGMSVPFPGNVLGALRMARAIKRQDPSIAVVWGGGWVNTELRELAEPRLFDFVDAVIYDDGERPLECLLEHFAGARPVEGLLRTRLRRAGEVVWCTAPEERDPPFAETARPTYRGLPLGDYLGLMDMMNPMHRLWSDTRWNKLTVAHGCYWKKCAFCDLSLDTIARFEPLAAGALVDRMEALIAETGTRGFHFVDEAAPPKVLRALAEEILGRGLHVSWWGNIRFESFFTPEVCALLAASGCIAVTGGLEAAHDRLLAAMHKGVSVAEVAQVTRAFNDAGILVHAYLIFGFPGQTVAETVDSLEVVRQLFVAGCLDSAHWHRLAVTAHAPLGQSPGAFGVRLVGEPPVAAPRFARNDLAFDAPGARDHDRLGPGLRKAVYNYMHGLGLGEDVRVWFQGTVPRTGVPRDFVSAALAGGGDPSAPPYRAQRPGRAARGSGRGAAGSPRPRRPRRKR